MPIKVRATLYRHFDANGVLLYVGCTINMPRRTYEHTSFSPWKDRISRTETTEFDTHAEALKAEKKAIQSENPLFNTIRYKRRHRQYSAHLRPGAYELACKKAEMYNEMIAGMTVEEAMRPIALATLYAGVKDNRRLIKPAEVTDDS